MEVIEIWKDVLGYEGLYKVSNLGRVKSLGRQRIMPNGGIRIYPEKILQQGIDGCGYFIVGLCQNGNNKTSKVHRLVFESFNGKTDLQVDHIVEGNKKDNRLCNLQAITNRENTTKHRLTLSSTSQYTGVCWDKRYKKWIARIRIKEKTKFLGYFNIEIDAHIAYQNALKQIK